MQQCRLNVLMDKELKNNAEILFNQMGLTMSTAINAFFRQTLLEQALPFQLRPYDLNRKKVPVEINSIENLFGTIPDDIDIDEVKNNRFFE